MEHITRQDLFHVAEYANDELKKVNSPLRFKVRYRNGYYAIDDAVTGTCYRAGFTRQDAYSYMRAAILVLQSIPNQE